MYPLFDITFHKKKTINSFNFTFSGKELKSNSENLHVILRKICIARGKKYKLK